MKKSQLVKSQEKGLSPSSNPASKLLRIGVALSSGAYVIARKLKALTSSKRNELDEATDSTSLSESQRAILDVHLEEYKQLSTEIKLRIDFQQKLTNYQLIAAGIIGTIGVRITQLEINQILQSEPVRYYLLFAPLVFLVFSWMFSNNDLMIIALARYISRSLAPKIRSILNYESVLGFEVFLRDDRKTLVRRYGLLALIGQEFTLQFVLPVLFLSIYLYLYSSDLTNVSAINRLPQVLLLLSNIVLYVLTLKLRFKIWDGYRNLSE